tara:strand:- start:218 stop:1189 length:972 start_codon:yes stop_codon:yes gene_type:complete
MGRFIGGKIGISTTPSKKSRGGAGGVWGIVQQNYFRIKDEWPFAGAIAVSGGNAADALEPGNGFIYHTFTATGTLDVSGTVAGQPGALTCDILVVAGGGGGGTGYYGGGGGGGGVIFYPNYQINGPITVTVGGGGGPSAKGSDSTISGPDPLIAIGGGYGGPRTADAGPGGSGGGTGLPVASDIATNGVQTTDSTIPANSRLYGHGNPGGPNAYGAGGGGASQTGGPGPDGGGGNGYQDTDYDGPLIGVPTINAEDGTFGGGGAGGVYPTSSQPGGTGGGGDAPGGNGLDNTGGGGAGATNNGAAGGDGGDGIVVIRYPDSII